MSSFTSGPERRLLFDNEDSEVNEIVDINTMYINICSYIKCKIDHNTYTTNTIKNPRVNSTLT